MRNAFRTPSPEKVDSEGNRKHSPWTAQRARKKGRSSPDFKLPGVLESQLEGGSILGGNSQHCPSSNTVGLALHLAQNPFLGTLGLSLPLVEEVSTEASQAASQQSLLFCSSQETALPQILPHLGPTKSLQYSANSNVNPLEPELGSRNLTVTQNCSGPILCTAENDNQVSISLEPQSLRSCGVGKSAQDTTSLALSSHDFLLPVNRCLLHQPLYPVHELAAATHGVEEAEQTIAGPKLVLAEESVPDSGAGSQKPDARAFMQTCTASHKMLPEPRTTEAVGSPGEGHLDNHGRSPLQEISPQQVIRATSVAPTPSPGVPAPGLRLDEQGRAPPRVSTSCRTIRRVLINSPQSSLGRPWSAEGSLQPMSMDKELLSTRLDVPAAKVQACNNDLNLHESEMYNYGANLTWMHATPETAEDSEGESMDNNSQSADDCNSPTFVLAKGHITPNNLLPGWDDEDEGPWGPRKGYYPQPLRRSGQLATFDERLQEAIENGDAMSLGQAWRDVKCGNVKPDDIDTLNTLLKCYCRVRGDPIEAEDIVKEACKDGRLLPNASTYHHMASLWTRHEQLNNGD